MSARDLGASRRVAELLREEAPTLDELHRARLERRFLEAAALRAETPDAAGSAAAAPAASGAGRSRVTWRRAGIGGLAALSIAAALVLALRRPGPSYSIERVRGGEIATGTVIEVGAGEEAHADVFDLALSARTGARVRFLAVSREDVRLELSRGEASFAFHPEERGREHVTIETPSARVEIVGTELSVRVEAHTTWVSVTEGRVRVVPANGEPPTFVSGGESVRVGDERMGREVEGEAAARSDEDRAPVLHDGPLPEPSSGAPGNDGAEDETPTASMPAALGAVAAPVGASAELETERASAEAESDDAPGVALSPRARLDRAEMMLDTDVEGARRELASLAGAGSPRAVRVDAHSLLGESYAAAHEIDAALREYAEAARLGRGTAGGATALFDGARLSERSGDTDAAREGFERYLRDYPDGANAVQARNRLEALGGTTGR